jgi:hypothetical protein
VLRCLCLLAMLLVLTGCGSAKDTSMPPLSLEPSASSPSTGETSPTSRSASRAGFAARVALQRLLRGIGAGDARVCASVAPAHARTAFGAAGCRAWVTSVKRHLTAADLTALRTVRVPTAVAGPGHADFTVAFTDLGWAGTPPQPGSAPVFQDQYVLRHTGSRWLLAG